MPDSLNLENERQLILLYAPPGHGKSRSVAHLIDYVIGKEHMVVLGDADRGITRALKEVGIEKMPENLDYFRLTKWEKMKEMRDHSLSNLGPGDWLVIENAKRIWQLAKRDYIEKTYGMDEDEFMEMKRQEAQQLVEEELRKPANANLGEEARHQLEMKIRRKHLQFEGLDGRTDWPRITTKYFSALGPLFDDGEFNILTTTLADEMGDDDTIWSTVGMKPGGQKELVAMHSTVVFAYQQSGEYFWKTDLGDATKDRGHERQKGINCTDIGFWQSYLDIFPEEEAIALGESK